MAEKKNWKKGLPEDLYHIAFEKGTDPAFSKTLRPSSDGIYRCAVCNSPLFSSDSMFETKMPGLMGWPSFEKAIPESVELKPDNSLGMDRTEVLCKKCGSHLGHVFDVGSETKTGKHFCINCTTLSEK